MKKLIAGGIVLAVALALSSGVSAQPVLKVTADTPVSFRATFVGKDTDAASTDQDAGHDFGKFEYDYWTVLLNLRTDGVCMDATQCTLGTAYGYYEIQVWRKGALVPDPAAPKVFTFDYYGGLVSGVVSEYVSTASTANGAGMDYLNTTVHITYDAPTNTSAFSGSIGADADTDGDGTVDTAQTDVVVEKLRGLRNAGVITGREVGQILKQIRQPKQPE